MQLNTSTRLRRSALRSVAVATMAVIAVSVTACGSSSNNTTSSSTKSSTATGKATLKIIQVSGYGKVLGTAAGKPVYLLTSDPSNGSSCTGGCATQWPPLTAPSKPTAGTGVNSSMLSTFKRSDGTTQVSYNGHALYTYTGSTAGSGAGLAEYGGDWYLVSASGNVIKSTASGGY
jgi:predicted lipoprotein with Yx(FWY)xxD motif